MVVFSNLIEKVMEVFMDDCFVYGKTFEDCLANLNKVLKRCQMADLVLNWEKCHFMVREGIVPWYTNIVNYIVVGYIPPGVDKKKIIRDSRLHLWDEQYLSRLCVDGLLRRCIPAFETWKMLECCH
jgi:hypothetical protein